MGSSKLGKNLNKKIYYSSTKEKKLKKSKEHKASSKLGKHCKKEIYYSSRY